MANILDRFKSTTVGSSGRVLDYSSKLSPNGDFTKLYDIDAILTSWNNILITPRGSMDHDPEFGCNLYLYLFEPLDEVSQEGIKDEIISSLSRYDDRATVEDVEVSFFKNKKGFNVSISVSYAGTKNNLSLTLDENTYQNFI